jgi:hypothetical protein
MLWLESPADQTAQFQEIDGKPEIYQILSSIIQKISQQSPRYYYKMLRESEESLAKLLGCDEKTAAHVLSFNSPPGVRYKSNSY